jgi:phospholipase C
LQGRDAATGLPTNANDFAGKNLNLPPYSNVDPGGGTASPSQPAAFAISAEDKDPPHEFIDVLLQLTGSDTWDDNSTANVYPSPNNSGFIASYRKIGAPRPKSVMESFDPRQLPVLTMLAREFAVCDNWFSSMPGPTWPNRFFVHAASSGGLDDSPDGLETTVSELIDGYRFAYGTLFDRLDDRCIDWRIFEGDELPQVFAISGMNLSALDGHYTDFEEFASDVAEADFKPAYVFIEPNYGNILPTTPGDFTCGNSQHPLDDATRGERLIKDVYEAIRKSPHWETGVLIVTYDEHGGFFDGVFPPQAVAPGDPISSAANNHHNFDFRQLGARVPAVVVSPLIPKGTIDHARYDHTSVIRTVSRLFGLRHLTARDAGANDLLHLFSLTAPRQDAPVRLPQPAESGFTCEQGFLTDLVDASDDLESGGGPETGPSGAPLAGAPAGEKPQRTEPPRPPARPPNSPPSIGTRSPRPVPSSFWGFMRVALRKSLLVIPLSDRPERRQVVEQYLAVRTEADARRFIHEARMRVRRYRHPDKEWNPLHMRPKGGSPGQGPQRGGSEPPSSAR